MTTTAMSRAAPLDQEILHFLHALERTYRGQRDGIAGIIAPVEEDRRHELDAKRAVSEIGTTSLMRIKMIVPKASVTIAR